MVAANKNVWLNIIEQAYCCYITMGRGRKGAFYQGNKKNKRSCGPLPKEERIYTMNGERKTPNQTIIDLPEEVLKALGQMNPCDVANILVNN